MSFLCFGAVGLDDHVLEKCTVTLSTLKHLRVHMNASRHTKATSFYIMSIFGSFSKQTNSCIAGTEVFKYPRRKIKIKTTEKEKSIHLLDVFVSQFNLLADTETTQ